MARLQDDLVTRERFDWDKVVQLFGRLKAAGMTPSDLNFLLRNLEVLQTGWDFISSLIIEENSWRRPEPLGLDEDWRYLCSGVQVRLESASSNETILVAVFAERTKHPARRFLLSEDWVEVVSGVQVRRVNDGELQVRSKKISPEPVVEEAETVDDEAGWRPAVRHYVSRGDRFPIRCDVELVRELSGHSWRLKSWEAEWSIVDASVEWREITPGVQVRWPNGSYSGHIDVRKHR